MDVSKKRLQTKKVTVAYDGESFDVHYYPRAVKLRDLRNPPDTENQAAVVDYTASMLARRVAKWDLTEGTTPVPIAYESLLDLEPDLINAVLEAINKDGSPGEATGSN